VAEKSRKAEKPLKLMDGFVEQGLLKPGDQFIGMKFEY
jgi:hypothetical protein